MTAMTAVGQVKPLLIQTRTTCVRCTSSSGLMKRWMLVSRNSHDLVAMSEPDPMASVLLPCAFRC